MEKYYSFAGVELTVSAPDDLMYEDDRNLESFRVSEVLDPHRFSFEMVQTLIPPVGSCIATMDNFVVYYQDGIHARYIGVIDGDWSTAYMHADHNGKMHTVELKADVYTNGMSAKTVLNAIEAEHLIAQNSGFVFHSSYIDVDGKAILFTAPSGTGKSTQAELWRTLRNAEVINGDRSAVRCTNTGSFACGIPFAGSSQICKNRTLPLAAMVYLSQAKETSIRKLRGVEAFRRVWEGVSVNTWDTEDLTAVMDTVSRLVENVPVYYLACTPDESAVLALEDAMNSPLEVL